MFPRIRKFKILKDPHMKRNKKIPKKPMKNRRTNPTKPPKANSKPKAPTTENPMISAKAQNSDLKTNSSSLKMK